MSRLLHNINTIRKKYRLIVLSFFILVCLNYNPQLNFETSYLHWGWNLSILATIIILFIFRRRDPKDWKLKLGIDFKNKDRYGFLSLFFVGILRNMLILKTNKIAFPWAIHLSFNMIFFSGFFISQSTNHFAEKPERFNNCIWQMVLITGSLAVLLLIWLNINRLKIIVFKIKALNKKQV
jgi:hypothetical protein